MRYPRALIPTITLLLAGGAAIAAGCREARPDEATEGGPGESERPRASAEAALAGDRGAAPRRSAAGAQEPRKLALIIAIAEYVQPPIEGGVAWYDINSDNDVPLIEEALSGHGFRDVEVVRDGEADRHGILDAFERLYERANPGDIVVIHYSGHGHQITDDEPGEEEDGLDELLVPVNAPRRVEGGSYAGHLHVRDDEFGEFLGRLRGKLGADGDLIVFLDACYSGSGTRGGPDALVRGGDPPLGPAAAVGGERAQRRRATGFDTDLERAAVPGARGGEGDPSPYVVLSAANHRELAHETATPDGTWVGSLTYALSRSLPLVRPGTSYQALYERVVEEITDEHPYQTPQIEGDGDRAVFRGVAVATADYVRVDSMVEDRTVVIHGGTVRGLDVGAEIEFHRIGTLRPEDGDALAVGTVERAGPFAAYVVLETPVDPAMIEQGAWGLVTKHSYGDMALRLRLSPDLPAPLRGALRERLSRMAVVRLVDENPQLEIGIDGEGVVERVVLTRPRVDSDPPGVIHSPSDLDTEDGVSRFVRKIQHIAQVHFLRHLDLDDEGLSIDLELRPTRIRYGYDSIPLGGGRFRVDTLVAGCEPIDWEAPPSEADGWRGGGQWELRPGDVYRVRVRSASDSTTHIALLDLMPDTIKVHYPEEGRATGAELTRENDTYELPCLRIEPAPGTEVLKVFATTEPVDFARMIRSAGTRGARGGLGALEQVFGNTWGGAGTRGFGIERGLATTREIVIHVVAGPETGG